MRRPRSSAAVALALTTALVGSLVAGCTSTPPTAADQDPSGPPTVVAPTEPLHDVGVQMFQWTWDAIARECTEQLGPTGVSWVLTSPPNEHITGEAWWTSYQPVSYRVESRLGTREQFADMVATCDAAGVGIVADAVINHMTGQEDPGTGWAGSAYEHYEYPGLYSDAAGDFHHCDTPDGDISTYDDAAEVQGCELVNLADLATEKESVRATIVAYLDDLLSLGVTGFRIDAAKHMPAEDVAAIVGELPESTFIVQEVIRGNEPVTPEQYVGSGLVHEFGYGRDVRGFVQGSTFEKVLDLGDGMLPSESAVVFVDNHDTERNGSTPSYQDGRAYLLANVLMLAGDYGTPTLYSGYAFSDHDAGPAQDDDGRVQDARCAGTGPDDELPDGAWVCQHRWPGIAGMVGWRAEAARLPAEHVVTTGKHVLSFSRGGRAFVAVNRDDEPVDGSWQTGLPAGTYCDVADGPVTSSGCAGATLTVAEDGTLTASVAGEDFVAIHVGARP